MFLMRAFRALQSILSFTDTQNSQFMSKLLNCPSKSVQVARAAFFGATAKPRVSYSFHVGLGAMVSLKMNCAVGKAKPVKFYPLSS